MVEVSRLGVESSGPSLCKTRRHDVHADTGRQPDGDRQKPRARAQATPRAFERVSVIDAMTDNILAVQNLSTHFFTRAGTVKAADDVSFKIETGSTLALVGESGSGKSVTSLS